MQEANYLNGDQNSEIQSRKFASGLGLEQDTLHLVKATR